MIFKHNKAMSRAPMAVLGMTLASMLAMPTMAQEVPVGTPIQTLKASSAKVAGSIKLNGQGLISQNASLGTEDGGDTATFTIKAADAGPADIYFKILTPTDRQDSWFVAINGRKAVLNARVSGSTPGWAKAISAPLKSGDNQLVVTARESGATLLEVAVMKPGEAPGPLIPPLK